MSIAQNTAPAKPPRAAPAERGGSTTLPMPPTSRAFCRELADYKPLISTEIPVFPPGSR